MGERKEKHSPPTEGEATGDPDDALLGSHRRLYGGEETLLADQFELHSRVYKNHQIVLLEVRVLTIREVEGTNKVLEFHEGTTRM